MADKWMKHAFPKETEGSLHRQLHVDEKDPIPKKKMLAALKDKFGELARERAQAAANANPGKYE